MWFGSPQDVKRKRAGLIDDGTGTMVRADWANPEVIDLDDAAVEQSSTDAPQDATRIAQLEEMSLYCPGDSDVRIGDRIVAGGHEYEIYGIPSRPRNPFTGWQPPIEIPLRRWNG